MLSDNRIENHTARIPAALAGWLAYVAVDFLTHAVFLAPWWRATEAYWLPPAGLVARIPFGYGAFAIYVAGVMWLVVRIIGPRPQPARAIRFGAVTGLVFGSASGLANYSVFAMPTSAILVWPASVTIASVAAVAAGVSTLHADRPWRQVLNVLLGALALVVAGVVLQNLFFPTPSDRLLR